MLRHNFLVWKLTPDPWPRWPHSAHPPHLKLMLLFSSSKLLLHHRHRRTFLWIVPSRIDLLRCLSKIAWTWSASANKPHAAVLPKPKYEEQRPARAAPRCWALTNRHLDRFIELYPEPHNCHHSASVSTLSTLSTPLDTPLKTPPPAPRRGQAAVIFGAVCFGSELHIQPWPIRLLKVETEIQTKFENVELNINRLSVNWMVRFSMPFADVSPMNIPRPSQSHRVSVLGRHYQNIQCTILQLYRLQMTASHWIANCTRSREVQLQFRGWVQWSRHRTPGQVESGQDTMSLQYTATTRHHLDMTSDLRIRGFLPSNIISGRFRPILLRFENK